MYSQYRCVHVSQMPRAARRRHVANRARRASSTRSPRSAWSARCGARVTPRWSTPRPRRTSARCSTGCASPTASSSSTSSAADEQAAAAARPGRRARLQLVVGDVHRRSHRRARPRPAPPSPSTPSAADASPARSSPCMEACRQRPRHRVQPLRLDDPQAGLHLRRPRPGPDRAQPQLRHGVGHRRLAPHPVHDQQPGPTRSRACASGWPAEITTTFASSYTARVDLAGALDLDGDRGLRQAGHRHEVPDHSPRLSECDGVNALSAVRFGRLRR